MIIGDEKTVKTIQIGLQRGGHNAATQSIVIVGDK